MLRKFILEFPLTLTNIMTLSTDNNLSLSVRTGPNDWEFADPVISLSIDGAKFVYRMEVSRLVCWCGRNNVQLNTMELGVDFR